MNFGKDIVNVDLECTGSEKEYYSICEIGAALVDRNTMKIKSEFSSLVRPYRERFDPDAMAVHGIPKDTLYKKGVPKLSEVLDMFQLWILKAGIVNNERKICLSAWGAYFDIPYLMEAYKYLHRPWPFDRKYICIKAIARWELGKMNQPFTKGGLTRCSSILHIPPIKDAHRALDDARQGALILEALGKKGVE